MPYTLFVYHGIIGITCSPYNACTF